jgi:imidazolonepropionase-like amidohydrolase
MKSIQILILFSFTWTTLCAQTTVIQNVNLIDVQTGKVQPQTTVLVNRGIVERVGKGIKFKLPAGTKIIDGTGKFLMPGMIDAHIHFFQSGGLYTRPDGVDLRWKVPYEKERATGFQNAADYMHRYLRLGITTVVDVGGPFSNFAVRDSITKTTYSPNVLVTGPLFSMVSREKLALNDPPIVKITDTKQADSLFNKMLPYKPDFIKVWYIAGPQLPAERSFPIVKHIAELAHQHNLKLTVHATELKTAQLAVEAGADILVHSVMDEVIPDAFVQSLKNKKVSYTPTLIVSANYSKVFSGKIDVHAQDLAFANAFAYGSLRDPEGMKDEEVPAIMKMLRKIGIPKATTKADSIAAINLKKLAKAGVNIITGTDAGNIGTFHASSYLQELEAMQKAGLSTAEVLKASTINAALAFNLDKTSGSIEKGKTADMILLDKNPLDSLVFLNTVDLIFRHGNAMKADTLIDESPESIVQRQVNAYNARNIDAFMSTYADDIKIFDFSGKMLFHGKAEMRKEYAAMFSHVPDLYCHIENRIILNNKIIDKENVRFNSKTVQAIAIYEVEDGKIKKVTFIE